MRRACGLVVRTAVPILRADVVTLTDVTWCVPNAAKGLTRNADGGHVFATVAVLIAQMITLANMVRVVADAAVLLACVRLLGGDVAGARA